MPDDPANTRAHRRRILWSLLLLVALFVLPYIGGWNYAFVYDDHGQIVENPFLESAGRWSAVLQLETLNDGAVINGRRPMVLLSFLLDRALWDDEPAGWRSSNYLFLGLSTVLLYLLVIRVVRRTDPGQSCNLFAFMAALLFAWHPAMVESVQVSAFRPDLLVVLFGLTALHGALGLAPARSPVKRGAYALWVLAAMWFALLSKESGAALPAVLALCWICFPGTRPGARMMASLLLGGLLLIGLFAVLSGRPGPDGTEPASLQAIGAEWNGRSLLFPDNLRTLPWLWWSYLRVLLWPVPLIVDRVIEPVTSWVSWRFIGGMLVLLGTGALWLVAYWKRWVWIAFGGGMILIGFAPVSNVIPLLNPMAERYMPLMIAGFALVAARVLAGTGLRAGRWPRVRTSALAILLVGYFVLGALRVQDFRDDETLWDRTLRDEPRSARAHTWTGLIMQRQGRLSEAVEHFEKARELNPHDLTPLINKAILYGRRNDLARAEELLREAIAIRPSFAPAHWNLAMALQFQGRMEEALEVLSETLRLDPYHIDARKARMVLLVKEERYREARADAERLVALVPNDPEARAALEHLDGK